MIEVQGHDLWYFDQIPGHLDPDILVFVKAQTAHFWRDEALCQSLTHILRKLIEDFESWAPIWTSLIMCQFQGQIHDVVFLVIFENGPYLQQYLDGLILDIGLSIIKELIEQPEDLFGCLVLLLLSTFFLDQLHYGYELVKKSDLDTVIFLH